MSNVDYEKLRKLPIRNLLKIAYKEYDIEFDKGSSPTVDDVLAAIAETVGDLTETAGEGPSDTSPELKTESAAPGSKTQPVEADSVAKKDTNVTRSMSLEDEVVPEEESKTGTYRVQIGILGPKMVISTSKEEAIKLYMSLIGLNSFKDQRVSCSIVKD